MRLALLGVGLATVLAFVVTGLYLAMHFPAAYGAGEEIRYMYRANHVYVLFAALVNIALGLYWSAAKRGWRGKLALTGTALVLVAPAC